MGLKGGDVILSGLDSDLPKISQVEDQSILKIKNLDLSAIGEQLLINIDNFQKKFSNTFQPSCDGEQEFLPPHILDLDRRVSQELYLEAAVVARAAKAIHTGAKSLLTLKTDLASQQKYGPAAISLFRKKIE